MRHGENPRRVIVTGAASGIGAAVARLFLQEGASVIAVDQSEDGLAELAGRGVSSIRADLTRPEDRARVVTEARGVSVLVNSAGIIDLSPFEHVTEDAWRAVLAINLDATFFLCRDIALSMEAQAAIINVASGAGKSAANHDAIAYNASKAGVIALTKSFAYALASKGIRVNCVCPGYIDSPMQEALAQASQGLTGRSPDDIRRDNIARIPLGRYGSPEEVATVIRFLASTDASYMTGQAINVTGGLLMY